MLKVKMNSKWIENVAFVEYREGKESYVWVDDDSVPVIGQIQDIKWVEDEEEGFEDEENFCTHGNLTTNDIIDKPNRGVAQCPDCGQIVKVLVKAWEEGDSPVACEFTTKKDNLDEPEEIECEHEWIKVWNSANCKFQELCLKCNLLKDINLMKKYDEALIKCLENGVKEDKPEEIEELKDFRVFPDDGVELSILCQNRRKINEVIESVNKLTKEAR